MQDAQGCRPEANATQPSARSRGVIPANQAKELVRYRLDGGVLCLGERTVGLDTSTRGWLRRYAPTLWGAGTLTGSLDSVRRRAFLALVGAISRVGETEWLTPLEAMLRAEDRMLQLQIASELGISVPRTVVTSDGSLTR